MNERIVSDTGPLISLEKMDRGFEFIQLLYETILVPPAVMNELTGGKDKTGGKGKFLSALAWIKRRLVWVSGRMAVFQ